MILVMVVVLVSGVKGQGAGLRDWFSNMSVHYHLQDLLKHRLLEPTPRFRTRKSELGPKNFYFNKFADETNDSGLGSIVWEPLVYNRKCVIT